MPIMSTIGGGSIRGFRVGDPGLYPFTTYTFTPAKTAPVGAGSYYVANYIGDGQKLVVPKTGKYYFKAVAVRSYSGLWGTKVIICNYNLTKGDVLFCVTGNRFAAYESSNGWGGDMTGISIYRSSPGIWGNYEPIALSGGLGGNSSGVGVAVASNTAITSGSNGGVDGDAGASWTTYSNPRNGYAAFAGYPFIQGYGGGGCIGIDGDSDGATGGGGGYSSGYGGTSSGTPGTSCYNVNATNVDTTGTELTINPYVTMTFLA